MHRPNNNNDLLVKKSKFVSYLLRHDTRVGELVDEKGFISLRQLNTVVSKDDHKLLTEQDLIDVTDKTGSKKRFEYEYRPLKQFKKNIDNEIDPSHLPPDQRMIYIHAMNGHSFGAKLNIYEPFVVDNSCPPKFLYHATNDAVVDQILEEGLKPMTRQFVHMYENQNQVRYDGKRNLLLQVGPINGVKELTLYRSKNGYIQCPHVIPSYLIQIAPK